MSNQSIVQNFPYKPMKWLIFILLLVACVPNPSNRSRSGVEIDVSATGSSDVNLDTIIQVVGDEFKQTMPNATFLGIVFSAPCEDLPQLRGTLVLTFVQTRWVPMKEEIFWGIASVDTKRGMMNLQYQDVSTSYPRTKPMPNVNHHQFQQIAQIAASHIQEAQIPNCNVTLTQMDNIWDVRCGKLADAVQDCHFAIINGKAIDLPKE